MRALVAAISIAACALGGSCVLVQRVIEPPFPSFDTEPVALPADARVLVFSKTHGYRHDSIPVAVEAVQAAALAAGLAPFHTVSGAAFTAENLRQLDVVVFVSANGTLLSPAQEAAFRDWVEQGGSVLLLHGAVGDFDRASPWWWELIGARFVGHTLLPHVREAQVRVTPHPITARLPARFSVQDELYRFVDVRVPRHEVLLEISAGESASALAWVHAVGRGTVLVNALGHVDEVWTRAETGAFLEDALTFLRAVRGRR